MIIPNASTKFSLVEDIVNRVPHLFSLLVQTPGPGAYGTTDASIYKIKGPQYSMAGRTTMPADSAQKPGPGSHSPEKVKIII